MKAGVLRVWALCLLSIGAWVIHFVWAAAVWERLVVLLLMLAAASHWGECRGIKKKDAPGRKPV